LSAGRRCARLSLLFLFFIAPLVRVNPDPEVYARAYGGMQFPLENEFRTGYDAAAGVEMRFLPFLGLAAQGEYSNLPVAGGDAVSVTGMSLGPSLIWRPANRVSLILDLAAGVYSASRAGDSISGISAGARVSAAYHVSPYLNIMAYGGVKRFAYTPSPLATTLSTGIGVSLNLSELMGAEVRISAEKTGQNLVFPVSYAWYNEHPFATVRITNNEPNDITVVNTSFYLEQYMNQPKLCTSAPVLQPGESVEVPLTAFFNETILQLTENITANAKIIVEYYSLGSPKRAEIPLEMPIYHRNAMSWDDDRRAASFVSARDPAALWFSRSITMMVQNRLRPGMNRNIQYALGMFEALALYGINYVVDPSSSYVALSSSATSLDSLNYPYQTLMYRGGDCDDLAILFCSLMEAVGVRTAFITIPGHIYMAFDSGMSEEEARNGFYAASDLVFYQGRAWVPLEITIFKEGFYRAWRIGARQWRDAASRGQAALYPTGESWQLYPPVSVPGAVSRFNLPEEEAAAVVFDRSLDVLAGNEIRLRVRDYETRLAAGENPGLRNELGVLYGSYGILDKAGEQFSRAAEMGLSHGWINLGNISYLRQRYREALSYYTRALTGEPRNKLALLGLARSYYELGDFEASDSHYARLAKEDGNLSRRYSYLASFFENTGRSYSLADRLVNTSWSLPEVPRTAEKAEEPEDALPEISGLFSMLTIDKAPLPGVGKLALPEEPEPAPAVPAEDTPLALPPAAPVVTPQTPGKETEEAQASSAPPEPEPPVKTEPAPAAAEAPKPAETPAPEKPLPAAEPVKTEPAVAVAPKPAETPAPAPEKPPAAARPSAPAKTEPTPPAVAVAPKPAEPPAPEKPLPAAETPAEAEPERPKEGRGLLYGILGAVLAAGGFAFFRRRKKKKGKRNDEK
jgi:tetratricopeptide (TPR) repeat protein